MRPKWIIAVAAAVIFTPPAYAAGQTAQDSETDRLIADAIKKSEKIIETQKPAKKELKPVYTAGGTAQTLAKGPTVAGKAKVSEQPRRHYIAEEYDLDSFSATCYMQDGRPVCGASGTLQR